MTKKAGFSLQGALRLEDKRSEHIDRGVWPLWIAATHGHSNKISSVVDDNDIATSWYMNMSRSDLGDIAAFQGTPILARGEYPPRLYHPTTHDAAF